MHIENNKEEVPFSYYAEAFAKADPAEISARLNLPFENNAFHVTLLGRNYTVGRFLAPAEPCSILCEGVENIPLPIQTFLLRYLLESKPALWRGQWKTFREMPWGEMYIKPYTGRVLTRAAFTFGTRVAAFRTAAEKMGAAAVKHGDAGFEFQLVGGYKMRILVWEGDDEFPPNAQILYSDNFAEGFAAEDRVVAGDILIGTIKSYL